jgi:chemotaxis signal transduction protein
MSTTKSHAWLLPLLSDFILAVSDIEMVEYLTAPTLIRVPLTPYYCNSVIAWREGLVPVFNLNPLFTLPSTHNVHHFGILAYQHAPKSPLQHLAVILNGSPMRVTVDDDQVTDAPEEVAGLYNQLVLSCFEYREKPVSILNITYLASREFGALVADEVA